MKTKTFVIGAGMVTALMAVGAGAAFSAQDRYSVAVPGGVAFAEFRGYETWQVVSVSHGQVLAVILGNPTMVDAYKAGIPANGRPVPDGAKMAKIHWTTKQNPAVPGQPFQPDALHDVDFMVKDSKRFADSGGWGYGAFEYDPASDTFRPGNTTDHPPQNNDAKCGFACHTKAKDRDYVFTEFPKR